MAKRGPQSTLNHLNWDESEEPEEAGQFAKASDEVIRQRVIKKARRRVVDDADSTGAAASSSVFGGFKGLASTPLAKAGNGGSKTFSFLSTLGAPAAGNTNGNGTSAVSSSGTGIGAATPAMPMFSFGSNATATAAASDGGRKGYPVFSYKVSSWNADSTDGAKSGPPASSGFGISSTKDGGTDAGKTSSTQPTSTDSAPKPFSFGSLAPKATDANQPGKTFMFGSPGGGKDATAPKAPFVFGSFAAKPDAGEGEKKSVSSPVATSKDSNTATPPPPPPKTGMFSFGSNAGKSATELKSLNTASPASKSSDAGGETSSKKTFTFGNSPGGAIKDPLLKLTAIFGSNASKPFDSPAPSNKDKGTISTESAKPSSTFSFGSGSAGKTGFGSPSTNAADAATARKPTFAFGGATSSPSQGNKSSAPTAPTPTVTGEGSNSVLKQMFSFADGGSSSSVPSKMPAITGEPNKSFEENVKTLNWDFTRWVYQQVQANALCKLHNVFRDYQQHFARFEQEMTDEEIEEFNYVKTPSGNRPAERSVNEADENEVPPENERQPEENRKEPPAAVEKQPEKEKPELPKSGFFFGTMAAAQSKEPSKTANPTPAPSSGGFSAFASSAAAGASGAAKPFSFGAASSATVSTSSPSFFAGASTFGAGKPAASGGFTFGGVTPKPTPAPDSSAATAAGSTEAEADEDEPPKVEFTPVEEKDSLYSKRCKLFVKAGGSYSDRGVGTLHIKRVDGKVQLLVRADTSLGNILLNIILNESVPLQRMGKNNVMMICLPTPDAKPPPTSVLLRVKTTEEADELHETLLKYKPK